MKSFVLSGFWIRVTGGLRVRVGVGDVFMVWGRDKVSVRAEGWLGFMYYGLKLFKLSSLWRRIRKVKQNCAENHSLFLLSGLTITDSLQSHRWSQTIFSLIDGRRWFWASQMVADVFLTTEKVPYGDRWWQMVPDVLRVFRVHPLSRLDGKRPLSKPKSAANPPFWLSGLSFFVCLLLFTFLYSSNNF